MSRDQQGAVYGQATALGKGYNTNANSSFNTAQQDVGNFASDVGAFKAANPYVQGGQVETAENQQLADTAAAGSQAAGQALQSQSVRTGQNAGGAIAATKSIQEQNARNLEGEQAKATERRIGAGTGYNMDVLGGEEKVEGMENQLAKEQGELGEGALGIEQKAGETPSFWDQLGGSFASGLGKAAGTAAAGALLG